MVGIAAWGAYAPRLRLSRKAVTEANAWVAPNLRAKAKGERSMANWDEDALTMAVEAARDALGPDDDRSPSTPSISPRPRRRSSTARTPGSSPPP
jgi:3-hydroxy-3-methylglutaryl CoA synthase